MKKSLKMILIVIGILVGMVLLDTLQALIFNNNIIIGIETKGMVKNGVLVNTYHCGNGENISKLKLSNYISESICAKELNETRDFIIVDKTKEINAFACASVLETFYEDENYVYSYSCIKSNYIIVRYDDGEEETVRNALKSNRIKIEDLDKYNIKYYKNKKTS